MVGAGRGPTPTIMSPTRAMAVDGLAGHECGHDPGPASRVSCGRQLLEGPDAGWSTSSFLFATSSSISVVRMRSGTLARCSGGPARPAARSGACPRRRAHQPATTACTGGPNELGSASAGRPRWGQPHAELRPRVRASRRRASVGRTDDHLVIGDIGRREPQQLLSLGLDRLAIARRTNRTAPPENRGLSTADDLPARAKPPINTVAQPDPA